MVESINLNKRKLPFIVGIGGFESEVGKTTLLCELLKFFPGWEAIKTTRGHYRSCGKDPAACCVSHLLGDEPLVRSGRESTSGEGKDTGRYWNAGATNVHWMIATDDQVEKGIGKALEHVEAAGVFVEGNSFAKFVAPDYFVMVNRAGSSKIKKTAKEALARVSAFYVSGESSEINVNPSLIKVAPALQVKTVSEIPIFTPSSRGELVNAISENFFQKQQNFRQTLSVRRAS